MCQEVVLSSDDLEFPINAQNQMNQMILCFHHQYFNEMVDLDLVFKPFSNNFWYFLKNSK